MPIYEYGCEACGHRLETQQKLSEPPLKTCPACGKDALTKLISPTAFVLKGGGWYKDGYGSAKSGGRSDTARGDRLSKAIDDDKKKTSSSSDSSSSSSTSSTPSSTPSTGGDSGGGSKSSAPASAA